MTGAATTAGPPGEAHDRPRSDDAAAERRWENEGGRVLVAAAPLQSPARLCGAQQSSAARH
jgi:hypothetical protein